MTLAFAADNTMAVKMMSCHERQGHWSVGADGKLHTDALGRDIGAEAWVVGDQLTISSQGMGLTYNRSTTT